MRAQCVLCEQESERSHEQGKDGYAVECDTCGKCFLGSPEIFEKGYIHMPRERRAMIFAYTRELFELGRERPEFGDDELLNDIIEDYEKKTSDQKLENLIFYIRKKTKQFGDDVPANAKRDYPITYSLSEEEFSAILRLAKERGLLTEGAKGLAVKLTEVGWRMSTKIMKAKTSP